MNNYFLVETGGLNAGDQRIALPSLDPPSPRTYPSSSLCMILALIGAPPLPPPVWPHQKKPWEFTITASSCLSPFSSLLPSSFHHSPHLSTIGGIRNSKIAKQFQYIQYICWIFKVVCGQKRFSTSHTQTLVHFLFLASLYFVGPTQTATLKCSGQPYHGRIPHPFQFHGWSEVAERSNL